MTHPPVYTLDDGTRGTVRELHALARGNPKPALNTIARRLRRSRDPRIVLASPSEGHAQAGWRRHWSLRLAGSPPPIKRNGVTR
ncbi:hypothetical protein [Thioalkalivibrio sp. ALJ8]|uniref:hypothetical protein n=1 Tax=Thioalkalivibrio sp. ALJ8 TaxID=1158757 RepID=UPI00036A9B32|nr:hypothetical protein [Thioalkalivibrio sp. ALJ8]